MAEPLYFLAESLLAYLISLAAGLRSDAISAAAQKKIEADLKTIGQQSQDKELSRSFKESLELIPISVAQLKYRLNDAFVGGSITKLCADSEFQEEISRYLTENNMINRNKFQQMLNIKVENSFLEAGATIAQAKSNAERFFDMIQRVVFANPSLSHYLLHRSIDHVIGQNELQQELLEKHDYKLDEIKEQLSEIHFGSTSRKADPPPDTVDLTSICGCDLPTQEPSQAHRLTADYQPGGAVEAESPYYIMRQADKKVMDGIRKHRGIVNLKGSSQTGKTSMINRLCSYIHTAQIQLRAVSVDFQSLPSEYLESRSAIWRAIAVAVDFELGLGALDKTIWRSDAPYDRNLTEYLRRFVFVGDYTPVLICLDEVNRVFGMPIQSEFFSSVRYFFNRGAHDPIWKNIRWLLSTSTEPSFFIDNLSQSPFNIGDTVPLDAFTFEETAEFVRCYGFNPDKERVERIMNCLGGRPYLVHLLLHNMAQQPEREESMLDAASAGGGLFKAHLDHYLARFQEQPALANAMKGVLAGKGCPNIRLAERLKSAGLVKENDNAKIVCGCELYSIYLGRRL